MNRSIHPSAEDRELWRRTMRHVIPLPGRAMPPPPPPSPHPDQEPVAPRPSAGASKIAAEAKLPRPSSAAAAASALDRFDGIDRATAERVRRGRYPIDGRLDLHGLTQAEAHRALGGFIGRSRAAGRRCLLVITGHGRSSGGILKTAVPRWLAEGALRPHVLAVAPARPMHGGSGALYVLLRRAPAAEGATSEKSAAAGGRRDR
jgi:DNA-nicking Smr family endonuclease